MVIIQTGTGGEVQWLTFGVYGWVILGERRSPNKVVGLFVKNVEILLKF